MGSMGALHDPVPVPFGGSNADFLSAGKHLIYSVLSLSYWPLRFVVRALCVVGVIMTGVISILWYFQESLLFHPGGAGSSRRPDENPTPHQNPWQLGMPYKDVQLVAADNTILHAWFIYQPTATRADAPTIIFFQGNAGNMGYRLYNIYQLYHICKANVLALHYRGYGYSEGSPSEVGLRLDSDAALDWCLAAPGIDRRNIYVFGRSIGGAVAIQLVARRGAELAGMIVENTFTSLNEMVLLVFPFLRPLSPLVRLIQRLHMRSLSLVPSVRVPTLWISGAKDALVPPEHMERLSSLCGSKVNIFHRVPNGNHNNTWESCSEYFPVIDKFLKAARALGQGTQTPEQINNAFTKYGSSCGDVVVQRYSPASVDPSSTDAPISTPTATTAKAEMSTVGQNGGAKENSKVDCRQPEDRIVDNGTQLGLKRSAGDAGPRCMSQMRPDTCMATRVPAKHKNPLDANNSKDLRRRNAPEHTQCDSPLLS